MKFSERRRERRIQEKAIVVRAEYLRKLLFEFGLALRGFDPGVCAYRDDGSKPQWDGSNYNFGRAEWNWLEPLLDELRQYRIRSREVPTNLAGE